MQSQSVWVIAEDGLNIRKVPREGKDTLLNAVPYGTELKYLRDSCVKGWVIISYEDKMRYVVKEWLSFEQEEEKEEENIFSENNLSYYGTCFITHYCPCEICCGIYASGYTANGSLATAGWTVASGEDLAFGTRLLINGQEYEVQDRGVGSGCIDIFCSSHEEASARGAYYIDVYILN